MFGVKSLELNIFLYHKIILSPALSREGAGEELNHLTDIGQATPRPYDLAMARKAS